MFDRTIRFEAQQTRKLEKFDHGNKSQGHCVIPLKFDELNFIVNLQTHARYDVTKFKFDELNFIVNLQTHARYEVYCQLTNACQL